MENGMITIAQYDYESLLKKAERIATVERIVNGDAYFSIEMLCTVLGIQKKENADGKL